MKKVIGKILIIVVPVVASILLLWPTYRAAELSKLQNEAFQRAKNAKTQNDSIAVIENFEKQYGPALLSAKANRLKLGLDLRGGMYVTLEVDVVRLLEESAQRDAIDETLTEVLNTTKKDAGLSDQDVIDIFLKYFNQIAKPKRKFLSDYFDFGGKESVAETEDKIIEKLKENEKDAVDQAMQVIRQRIDKYGISEPTIQKIGSRRILLELPGVTNEAEMSQLLQTTARLEFKLVRCNEALVSSFYKIDQYLAKEAKNKKATGDVTTDSQKPQTDSTLKSDNATVKSTDSTAKNDVATDSTKQDTTKAQVSKSDTANPYAGLNETETKKRYLEDHPFTQLFDSYFVYEERNRRPDLINYAINNFPKGDYNFQIFETTLKHFQRIIARKDIQDMLPYGIELLLSAKPQLYKDQKTGKQIKAFNFYGLKRESEMTGDVITNAVATYDPTNNQPIVNMSMDNDGSDKWAQITGANIKKRIAIVLDGQVYSAPVVNQKIVGGSSQITGMENAEEAKLLKIVLKAGALKAPVQMIEKRIVGPSLGEDSIRSGLTAFLIAILLVILFMSVYYVNAGFIAILAVIINITMIVAIMAAFQGTLSLPGIAGIILTLGMAVDANILIYERVREELFRGRSLRSAIDEGFSKALTAIIDTHLTTFITGLILYFVGTGPIQGFAMTLMIGVLCTLFTAILVTRAMFEVVMSRGITSFNFGQPKIKENKERV